MRYAFLVALREYAENARTKGFWIGIVMFPVVIALAMTVMEFLQTKAIPTRDYVLVDQSGSLGEVIEQAVRRAQARKNLEAWQAYARKYYTEEARAAFGQEPGRLDPGRIRMGTLDFEKFQQEIFRARPELLDMVSTVEGWERYKQQSARFLREDRPPFQEPRLSFQRVALPPDVDPQAPLEEIAEALKPYLNGQRSYEVEGRKVELFAAILVPEEVQSHITRGLEERALRLAEQMAADGEAAPRYGVQYWAANLADKDLLEVVRNGLRDYVEKREFERLGLDLELVRRAQQAELPVLSLNAAKARGEEEETLADFLRQWAPSGFTYLLWVAIMTVAQMLLNNTIEEKSNRLIEVLLSSVTAGELMMGKLIGIAAIGLTMMTAWVLSLLGLLYWKAGPEAEWAFDLLSVVLDGNLILYFGIYFLFGYAFYASIFLAIGSVCNTIKEAQNFMGVVMIFLMAPMFLLFFIPKDPHGPLATITSWIPLYTPFVMMNRVGASPPPSTFEMAGTMLLAAGSAVLMLWLCGRIFRIGILRTGQPPKFLEMLRWLRSEPGSRRSS